MKFGILRRFVSIGYSVLLSDVDVCIFRNPFANLYRDSDVEGMSDGALGYEVSRGVAQPLHLSALTGMTHGRKTMHLQSAPQHVLQTTDTNHKHVHFPRVVRQGIAQLFKLWLVA